MIKKVFGLFVTLSFVLFLAACAQSSKLGESFKQQPLSYNIHMKVLEVTGYLDDFDSYYVHTNGRELVKLLLAYPDSYYNQLFTELGITERDFYCTPTLDVFARSTIFDMRLLFSSYNDAGLNAGFYFLHAPTLSGDRYSSFELRFNSRNNKFESGTMIINPELDQYVTDGIITQDTILNMGESYHEIVNGPSSKVIELIDVVKYEFGHYYVPDQIFWPQGVEKPAPEIGRASCRERV